MRIEWWVSHHLSPYLRCAILNLEASGQIRMQLLQNVVTHLYRLFSNQLMATISDFYPISHQLFLFLSLTLSLSWNRSGNECKCLPPAFKIAENLMDWFPGFVKLSLIANQPSGNAVNSSTLGNVQSITFILQVKCLLKAYFKIKSTAIIILIVSSISEGTGLDGCFTKYILY